MAIYLLHPLRLDDRKVLELCRGSNTLLECFVLRYLDEIELFRSCLPLSSGNGPYDRLHDNACSDMEYQ